MHLPELVRLLYLIDKYFEPRHSSRPVNFPEKVELGYCSNTVILLTLDTNGTHSLSITGRRLL